MSAWKRQLLDAVPEVFAKGGRRKLAQEHEAKFHDLHAKIGELTVEQVFFRRGLDVPIVVVKRLFAQVRYGSVASYPGSLPLTSSNRRTSSHPCSHRLSTA